MPVNRNIKILFKYFNCLEDEIKNNGMGKIVFHYGVYIYIYIYIFLKVAYTKALIIQGQISFKGSTTVLDLTTFKCLIF